MRATVKTMTWAEQLKVRERALARRWPSFVLRRRERQLMAELRHREPSLKELARLGATRAVLRGRSGTIPWV